MNVQDENLHSGESKLCQSCKSFYGSENTQQLCSSCYKASQKQLSIVRAVEPYKQITPEELFAEKLEEVAGKKEEKKRCAKCTRNLGLLGTDCKCGMIFCNKHRLPEEHSCMFDHRKAGQAELKKTVVKVYNGKLTEM